MQIQVGAIFNDKNHLLFWVQEKGRGQLYKGKFIPYFQTEVRG